MSQGLLTIQRFKAQAGRTVCLVALCSLLSSCAPINNQPGAAPRSTTSSNSSSPLKRASFAPRMTVAKLETAPSTIFGFKVPQALSFSHLTRFLANKDESLDQAPAPLPSFPTVADVVDVDDAIDSAAIEDERSMLLLSEAERFAEFSENKTLSEIARGSLNRTMELVAPTKESSSFKISHKVIIILALCVGVLLACGYFVVSFLLDDLRVRNAPRFGSMQ